MSIYKYALSFCALVLFAFPFFPQAFAQTKDDLTIKQPGGQKQIDLGEKAQIEIRNLPKKDETYILTLLNAQGGEIDKVQLRTRGSDGACFQLKELDDPSYNPLVQLEDFRCGVPGNTGDKILFLGYLNTNKLEFDRTLSDYTYSLRISGGGFGANGVSQSFTVYNNEAINPSEFQVSFKPSEATYGENTTATFTIANMRKVGSESIYAIEYNLLPGSPTHSILIDDAGCDESMVSDLDGAWPRGSCEEDGNGAFMYTGAIAVDKLTGVADYFQDSGGLGERTVTFTVKLNPTSQNSATHEASITIKGPKGMEDTCDPAIKEGAPGYKCPVASTCKPTEENPEVGFCERLAGVGYIEIVSPEPKLDPDGAIDKDTKLPIPRIEVGGNTIVLKVGGLASDKCYYLTVNQINSEQQDGAYLRPDAIVNNPHKPDYINACEDRSYYGPVDLPGSYSFKDSYPELIDKYPNVMAVFDGKNGGEQEVNIPMLLDGAYKLQVFDVGTVGFGLNGRKSDDGLKTSLKVLVGRGTVAVSIPPCKIMLVKDRNGNFKRIRVTSNSLEYYEELFKDSGYEFVQCAEVRTAIGAFRTDPREFVSDLMAFLLSISGMIAIILIIRSGYIIMMSRADPEKIQQAREILTSAIVGLLFLIFSLVILEVIGVDILKLPCFGENFCPEETINLRDERLVPSPPSTYELIE